MPTKIFKISMKELWTAKTGRDPNCDDYVEWLERIVEHVDFCLALSKSEKGKTFSLNTKDVEAIFNNCKY